MTSRQVSTNKIGVKTSLYTVFETGHDYFSSTGARENRYACIIIACITYLAYL